MIYLFQWRMAGNAASGQFIRAQWLRAQPVGVHSVSLDSSFRLPLSRFVLSGIPVTCTESRFLICRMG